MIKKPILLLFLTTLIFCNKKNNIFQPSLLVLASIGDVRSEENIIDAGETIQVDKILKVGKKSICDLQIINVDSLITIRLQPEREFILHSKSKSNKKILLPKIKKGKAFFNITKLSGKEEFTAITSAIKTTVKGTQFYLDVDSNGKTKLGVNEGYVLLKPGVIELDDLPLEKIKHLSNVQSIIENENKKELNIPSGYAIHVSDDPVNNTNKIVELVAFSENLDSSTAQKLKIEDYFSKEEIIELSKEEKKESKEVFLELPPIPIEYNSDPEKLKWAVLSRLDKMNENLTLRMEKILEKTNETFITKSGKRIRGIIFLENKSFYIITLRGTEVIPEEEVYSIELH